jgi:hypothetical protein
MVGDMRRSVLVLLLPVGLAGCGSGSIPTPPDTTVRTSTLAVGGPPQRGITLDHRIGPVSFRESEPKVTKALGDGVSALFSRHRVRFYPNAGIYVDYAPGPPNGKPKIAIIIVTRSPRYKTRSGVGVGSSLQQLRRSVKVTCYPAVRPGTCQHERANINLPFTVFNLDGTGRVTQVAVVLGGD